MKIFLLILVLFLLSLSAVYADDFGVSGNVDISKLYLTTAIGYSVQPMDISYNEVDRIGLGQVELRSKKFSDYAVFLGDSYRRMVGADDRVLVPPLSKILVYAYLKNETDHSIDIKDFTFYASRTNPMWGTWENLGIPGFSSSFSFKIYGSTKSRLGFRSNWPVSSTILSGEEKNLLVSEFTLPQFIEVLEEEYTSKYASDGSLSIDYKVVVKNSSGLEVKDVIYSHGSYFYRRNFLPEETYTYEYTIQYGFEYILGENKFYNYSISVTPDIRKCIVIGSTVLNRNSVPDSRSLFVLRNDQNSLAQFTAIKEIDWYPGTEGLCIEVLPYWILGKEVKIDIQPSYELDMTLDKFSKSIFLSLLNFAANGSFMNPVFLYDDRYVKMRESCGAIERFSSFEWNVNNRKFECNMEYDFINRNAFVRTPLMFYFSSKYKREEIKITPDIEFEIVKEGSSIVVKNNSSFDLENLVIGEKKYFIGRGESAAEIAYSDEANYSYSEIVGSVKNL